MSAANNRANNWVFTLNKALCVTAASRIGVCDEMETLLDNLVAADEVSAYAFQGEVGAEGTFHIQGMVVFKKQLRFAAAKSKFNDDTIHMERMKGTRQQAYDYCTKTDTRVEGCGPYEHGTVYPC